MPKANSAITVDPYASYTQTKYKSIHRRRDEDTKSIHYIDLANL